MKFLIFLVDLFYTKKIKSEEFNSITSWEISKIYKSIKKHKNINCLNCESNVLKLGKTSDMLYCDLCGQCYVIYKSHDINNYSNFQIINIGIHKKNINFDVQRYKKLLKIKNRHNVYTNR